MTNKEKADTLKRQLILHPSYLNIIEELEKDLEILEQYKNIEKELGIDLITLFKALKNGIYCKIGNKIEHILAPHLSWYCQQIYICNINDYGKTWSLTREELENE